MKIKQKRNKKEAKRESKREKKLGEYCCDSICEYLKESRNQLCVIFWTFLFFILLGFFYPLFFDEQIKNLLKTLIEQTKDLSVFELIFFILKNNLTIGFFCLFLGVFLAILPIFSTILNGYVLGFVGRLAVEEAGYLSLLKILPYGIFEIPAIILSLGLGVRLGLVWFTENPSLELARRLKLSLLVFLLIVLPLLIVAAIIEGVLTFFWS